MTVSFTLIDIVKFLMYICLSGLFISLIVFFIRLSGILSTMRSTILDNKKDIDQTMTELPRILRNVDNLTDKTDRLIGDISPDVKGIASNVNRTTHSVGDMSENVSETVDYVAESVTDATTNIKYGITSTGDYLSYVIEIFNFVKSLFNKKK